MKATLTALLMSLATLAPSISTAQSTDDVAYEARVTNAAAHFLVDVRLVKLALTGAKTPSRVQVCYRLGILNYTTNQLFNLAYHGNSTEARRTAAKEILQAKADFEVTCGSSGEDTAVFQFYKSVPQRLTTIRQILTKLDAIDSIATKIHKGEIR